MMKEDNLKHIDDWGWTTLVASWRYYEHRMTITSASFPQMIIAHYFSGEYDDDTMLRIAQQFADVDHGRNGEMDWTDDKYLHECDKKPWTKFYAFCWHYVHGWKIVNGVKCFHCIYTNKNYPADEYIKRPAVECYMVDPNE